jgi:hypothetical protein
MREKLKKIVAYIFRSWEDKPTHSLINILSPFFYELIAYLISLAILYQIGAYLWSVI